MSNPKRNNLLFAFSLCCISSGVFAWGKIGHMEIASLANEMLTPAVKDSVQKYLGNITIEQAATWMDDVRGDKEYAFLKPFHYVDIEKDKTYVPVGKPNLVNELQKVIKELEHKKTLSAEQIYFDLKILIHLVGDIGQPLHVGYPEDVAGNEVKVMFEGKETNLHHVWDTGILQDHHKDLNPEIETLKKALTPLKKQEYSKIDVLTWVSDSQSLLPQVYNFQNSTIDKTYETANLPVIERQLLKSGIRLAAVLNSIFIK